jgi:Kelch motif
MDHKEDPMNKRYVFLIGVIALLGLLWLALAPAFKPRPACALLTGRYGHAAVADEQRIYVVGGSASNGFLGTIEALDPDRGTTEVLTDQLIPRRYLSAVLRDGKIYILGGVSRKGYEPALEIYDLQTGRITRGPELPTPRRMAKAGILDNRIYVIGGEPRSKFRGREQRVGLVEVLDLDSQTWQQGPRLKTARDCAVASADGKLYAIGGFSGGRGAMRKVESYDPSDMIWQQLPDLPFKMSAHSAVAVDNQIFTFGDYKELDRVAMLDLESGDWQRIEVDYAPGRHNATVQFDDELFVIGGNVASSDSHLDTVQRFRIRDLKKKARPIPAKPAPTTTGG